MPVGGTVTKVLSALDITNVCNIVKFHEDLCSGFSVIVDPKLCPDRENNNNKKNGGTEKSSIKTIRFTL